MKLYLLTVLSIFVYVALPLSTPPVSGAEAKTPKVLLIGIDGVRPDALIVADTPNINQLIASGTFDPTCQILGDRYRENNTVSGASWSSVLTGTWADKHGVHDNSFEGRNYGEYPHFFEYIKAAKPEAKTVSLVSVWRPIDRYIVSAADIRDYVPLAGVRTTNLNIPADEVREDTRDGEWHHLLGLRRGGKVHLFLNGEPVAETYDTAGDFDLKGEVYHIGRDARGDRLGLKGDIRGVGIWNRALSESEIRTVAGGGAAAAPVLFQEGTPAQKETPLDGSLRGLTRGDFTVSAFFRTTDTGRNILMGNYGDAPGGHLNLELHTDNRVRLYVNPTDEEQADRMVREEQSDGTVADKAVDVLESTDPTALWVYLHQPDAGGHRYGFSPKVPEYMQAIENVDRHVGRMVEAIRSRPGYDEEDWLIVMTTDHGGYGTRHGGGHDIPEILTGFLLVSGDAAHHRISPEQTFIVDAVPTVLKHLGIEPDPGLDGRPVGFRD